MVSEKLNIAGNTLFNNQKEIIAINELKKNSKNGVVVFGTGNFGLLILQVLFKLEKSTLFIKNKFS